MTAKVLQTAASRLRAAGRLRSPLQEASRLLNAAQRLARERDEGEAEVFEDVVNRRCSDEPLAYITGVQDFMGKEFTVRQGDGKVLIPREDTEVLVHATCAAIESCVEEMNHSGTERRNVCVVELGVGSGAVLLSAMLRASERGITVHGVGIDVSDDALLIASSNARRLAAHMVDAGLLELRKG